jgi:hypothetical protein
VQEKDKNTLGGTKRERDTESVWGPFSGETLLQKDDFIFFKMAKESAYGLFYSPTFGGKKLNSKNHEN